MTEYLTTKELAELLRIKERKVYDLAANGDIPCSRATGKLLFPRNEVNQWLARKVSGGEGRQPRPQLMLGSHDPLLEWVLRESQCGLASYFDSSLDGLDRFANGEGMATGLHLYDAPTQRWNQAVMESRFSAQPVVLVEWARRQRGVIMRAPIAPAFSGLKDLAGMSLVPRQAQAGSQVLLEALLAQQGIERDQVRWGTPARSEADAVLAVVEGRADAAFGLASLAAQYRLEFVAIIDERYDLLVERRAWFEPAWQSLLAFCRGSSFSKRAREFRGYDVGGQFRVHFNGAG